MSLRYLLPGDLTADVGALAQVFSGNQLIPGSAPIAMVYAGHQFGQFVPQLGDGRAHLIGEVIDQHDNRRDIQLKGSGRTAFSRDGDGRCALGPAVREFIMSEAMYALGVPTTRCLAVVTTGEQVYRQQPLPGAVVTRVAASHLRVGTFQYFAARGDQQALITLCNYAIERHYPELLTEATNKYASLLDNVIERQIRLVVDWMRVGFIHGVMNTDNTAISGETIDYGPCAMMSRYDPQTVFSSIDLQGRYAFGHQPNILQWNMARFAECLLPLIDSDHTKGVDIIEPLLIDFPERFKRSYLKMMGQKLGLIHVQDEDEQLIHSLLELLRNKKMDYTVTFHQLSSEMASELVASPLKRELGEWFNRWQKRILEQPSTRGEVLALMRQHNPVVIPRNHHVEEIIQSCMTTGSAAAAEQFLEVLRSPYEALSLTDQYQDPPSDGDACYQTFCGT